MKPASAFLFMLAGAALSASCVFAAYTPLPNEVKPAGKTASVTYIRWAGTASFIDMSMMLEANKQLCAMQGKQFRVLSGDPDKIGQYVAHTYVNARQRARYFTTYQIGYVKSDPLCLVVVEPHTDIELVTFLPGGRQRIVTYSHAKGHAQQMITAGNLPTIGPFGVGVQPNPNAKKLGKQGTHLNIPCEWIEEDFPGYGKLEMCVGRDHSWPAYVGQLALLVRTVATGPKPKGVNVKWEQHIEEIDPYAEVDIGVFSLPEGVPIR